MPIKQSASSSPMSSPNKKVQSHTNLPLLTERFGTLAVHLGHGPEPTTGAIIHPISLSTTFAQRAPGQPIGEYEYSRSGNPTRQLLESAIAKLEDAKYGLAFASGCSATAALGFILPPSSHVLSVNDVYGGTKRFFTQIIGNNDFSTNNINNAGLDIIQTTYCDMTKFGSLKEQLKPNTRMIWIESPTNPTLTIVDISQVVQLAREHESLTGTPIIVVVDNTFLTPYFQRPLFMGADVVIHSATKYLNGHCDVVMGLVVTNNVSIHQRLAFLQNALGAVPSPLDCYLLMRGLRTLHVRMEKHAENAMKVALFLESHPRVERVFYSGLPSHPQYELAKRQQFGHGGMVSFRLASPLSPTSSFAGERRQLKDYVTKFCQSTRIFILAESLGGFESLIDVPAAMTHGGVPEEERLALGITDGFIRLSVGIEDADDLVSDLENALNIAYSQ